MISLIHGDCLEELDKLESNSVDILYTDPPYIPYVLYTFISVC